MTDQSAFLGRFEVRTFDTLGANELQPVVQGMANRLGVGAQRYGRSNGDLKTKPRDMVDTAILRAEVALQEGNREGLVDAMNFLFLAYRRMPAHEPSESSPGVVNDGVIVGARGVHEPTNGSKFERGAQAPVVREPTPHEMVAYLDRYVSNMEAITEGRIDDIIVKGTPLPVQPSFWTEVKRCLCTPGHAMANCQVHARHFTGGSNRWDVV